MIGKAYVEIDRFTIRVVDRSNIHKAYGRRSAKIGPHTAEVVEQDVSELKVEAHALANAGS